MPKHYNPMLERLRNKQAKSKGYLNAPKQEKKLAKRIHAWRVPGSGSGKQKGDVRAKGIARVECKCTQKKSFSITREMLDKIDVAAGATGEIPIIHVEFLDEDGKIETDCAVVPMWVLERLISDADDS